MKGGSTLNQYSHSSKLFLQSMDCPFIEERQPKEKGKERNDGCHLTEGPNDE